jgi:hypothetical protein
MNQFLLLELRKRETPLLKPRSQNGFDKAMGWPGPVTLVRPVEPRDDYV